MKKALATIALLAFSTSALSQAGKPANLEQLRNLAEVYRIIDREYVTEPDERKVFAGCINGMLTSLDKRSEYIDESRYAEWIDKSNNGQSEIGIHIISKAGLPYIVSVTEGAPAARAGLKPRDYLLSIDGEPTEEMDLDTANKRLKGPPGSAVKVVLRRYGELEEREFSLTREFLKPNLVHSHIIDRDVAYVRLTTFSSNTVEDFVSAFNRMKSDSKGKLRGMILDLRGSPGGTVPSVVDITSIFFQSHVAVMSTKGRLPDSNLTVYADEMKANPLGGKRVAWPAELAGLPLAVLIDSNTASGSEILAGAIKDHKRGTIIGQKSMGIGTLQTIRHLDGKSAAKLTTALHFRPSGLAIQGIGIEPDIAVATNSVGDEPWISAALQNLPKNSLKNGARN